ncbi:MAG: chemotaxis-specific protein-glutamate methyltransferase CheB [bacterium]
MVKVLIVDDSPVAQKYLEFLLGTDENIQIIGIVNNGEEACEFVARQRPDVITMDIEMPKMNGYEATRRIMETYPVPIIIVTASWNPSDVEKTFKAMEAGAVAVLAKPPGPGDPNIDQRIRELIQTIKLMAEVPVVKRWAKKIPDVASLIHSLTTPVIAPGRLIQMVAIGTSTGGPPALYALLSKLPKNFPVPILIVQHIASGFIKGMADWLEKTIALSVRIPVNGERPLPGYVYLAPDAYHMEISRDGTICLIDAPPDNGLRPSVAHLFSSVAEQLGDQAIGVLLTGMGRDGALELKQMKDRGAITIAQDQKSSVVHGMPGEAIKLGAAVYIQSPDEIANSLIKLVCKQPASK